MLPLLPTAEVRDLVLQASGAAYNCAKAVSAAEQQMPVVLFKHLQGEHAAAPSSAKVRKAALQASEAACNCAKASSAALQYSAGTHDSVNI